jgi:hypothetical protein
MDVHLLINKIQCCEGNVQLTGHEEGVPLSPSMLLGMPSLTLEGCNACRVVVTSGGGTGGGGAMLLATSWLPMMAMNFFRVSFMAQMASACSLSLFSICWSLSSSMAGELMTFRDCYRGGTGVSRL